MEVFAISLGSISKKKYRGKLQVRATEVSVKILPNIEFLASEKFSHANYKYSSFYGDFVPRLRSVEKWSIWDFLIFQSQISFSKIKRGKVGAKNEVGKKMEKNREEKKLNLFRNCPPSIRGIFRNIPRIQIGTPKILKIKTLYLLF